MFKKKKKLNPQKPSHKGVLSNMNVQPSFARTQMTEDQSSSLVSQQRPPKLPRIESRESIDRVKEEADEEREAVERNMTPNPKTQRYLVAVEYVGTRFSGAQKQSSCRTVVGVLEVTFSLHFSHEP